MKQLTKLVTGIVATMGLLMGLSGITGRADRLAVTGRVNASEQVLTHLSQQPPQLRPVIRPAQAAAVGKAKQQLPQTDETNPLKVVLLGVVLLGLSILSRWNLFDGRRQ